MRNYFVKRVLNDLRGEIQNLIEDGNNERSTIETKFTDAKRYSKIGEISPEAIEVANLLSQDCQDMLDTQAKVDELIRILRLSESGCLHWHIANQLRMRFNDIVAGLTPNFGPQAVRKSDSYQEFTHSYMGNYRLRLERPGGETRLFRFLLASPQPENASNLMLGSQSREEEFPIPNLSVLYQMEVGFTPDDLRVVGRLKEEYDSYIEKGDPIHIDKDPTQFNPDAIRATIAAGNRMEEIQRDSRALRELLPRIREKYENRFQYVSPNGNINGNSPLGELEVIIPDRVGYEKTFRVGVDNEKLVQDEDRYDFFINATRADFGSLLDENPSLLDIINGFNQQIESTLRRESENFYENYIGLVREHHRSHQD